MDAVVGRTPVDVGRLRAGDHGLGGGTALDPVGAADVPRSIRQLCVRPGSAWEAGPPAWPAPITTASCCAAMGDSFLLVLSRACEPYRGCEAR